MSELYVLDEYANNVLRQVRTAITLVSIEDSPQLYDTLQNALDNATMLRAELSSLECTIPEEGLMP